jgi:hypothetical protein
MGRRAVWSGQPDQYDADQLLDHIQRELADAERHAQQEAARKAQGKASASAGHLDTARELLDGRTGLG